MISMDSRTRCGTQWFRRQYLRTMQLNEYFTTNFVALCQVVCYGWILRIVGRCPSTIAVYFVAIRNLKRMWYFGERNSFPFFFKEVK